MCTSWPFFATPGTSAGMGPLISAWITTVFPTAGISSITLTRKFGTAFGNARQIPSMPPRIGTTLSRPYGAYRPSAPSAQRASMPSTSWASYAVKNCWAVDTCSFSIVFTSELLWIAFFWDLCGLVFEPLAERLDLFLPIRREQVLNGDVGRRNQNRFRVRESVKPGLAVVVTNAGISDPSKWHGFDKQVNVHLIDRTAAKGQAREEVIDRLLVAAKQEAGKRLRMLFHLANGSVHVLVGEDWEKGSEDLVLHDRVVPCHWIDNRGIEIACIRVRGPAYDDFLLIDQACQTFSGLGANDAGVVVPSALGVGPVQLDHRLLALSNKLLCNRFVHVGVSGRSAPLAAPGRSPPDNLFGCVRDIGGRINKGWVLAPEFEKNRS